MRPRHCLPLLVLTGAAFLVVDASPQETARSGDWPSIATGLQEGRTATFSEQDWLVALLPVLCDPAGNISLLLTPKTDPRDVRARKTDAQSPTLYTKPTNDILRVSADGKRKTTFRPSDAPFAKNAESVRTATMGFDSEGRLHALVWAHRGEASSQYLVSFDDDGRYRSHLEIPQEQIVAGRFWFFGSGHVLLAGSQPYQGPRVVVMSPDAASFRDVIPSGGPNDRTAALKISEKAARGGDGRIYFVPPGKESIHVVSAYGESEFAFDLAPAPREYRLVDLKASGQRVVATYFHQQEGQKPRFWMDVYNTAIGERLALYGPAFGPPLCYDNADGQDRFTVLKTANSLVSLSSPK